MQVPPLEPAAEALAAADEFNKISVPLGYAVMFDTNMPAPPSEAAPTTTFFIRQLGGNTVHVTSDPASVERYLEELASKPRWRLNLDDDSIEVSGAVITDKRTGEELSLSGGWSPMIGRSLTIAEYRTQTGVDHLSVVGDQPPAVGSWHRWPAPVARD